MSNKRLNIGIDIDGTLTHPGYFIPHLNKLFNKNIVYEDIRVYDFRELYQTTDEVLTNFFIDEEKGILFQVELLKDAKRTVLELAEKHNVHIITARRKEIHDRTRAWLDKVGLDKIELHSLGTPNKRTLAEELGCHYFFEDHPTASAEIADAGISVLLMDAPYNRHTTHDNLRRVHSWADIRSELTSKGVL
ncbi:MAG: hypothetical protein Q4D77_03525 [Peptostreptococcaceae bacterium]|nr:hypothetical protein [Peptostreptococcaceae bacterium]